MQYPTEDDGLYHLTRSGWVRKDRSPFPQDRVETWSYRAECPAEDAKEQVCLVRIWRDEHLSAQECETLHARFGMPVSLQTGRNITLECEV
jgi:hypothetical protein